MFEIKLCQDLIFLLFYDNIETAHYGAAYLNLARHEFSFPEDMKLPNCVSRQVCYFSCHQMQKQDSTAGSGEEHVFTQKKLLYYFM